MVEHLSVSQVNTYLSCPRKYRFRYIDRLEPEQRSRALALGTAVHSAIAWWQSSSSSGLVSKEELDRVFKADWTAELASGLYPLEGVEDDAAVGRALVDLFVTEKLDEPAPLQVDVRFEIELPDAVAGGTLPVPLIGYYDYLGFEGVGEIKTSARTAKPDQWELQLAAYSYAATQQIGVRPEMEVVQLIKTRTPKVKVDRLTMTSQQEDWFIEVASEVWHAVGTGRLPPSPGWACNGCEFRRACRGA